MTKGTQQSSLDNVSKNTVVNGEHGPQVYFHPGSATLLCVDARDNHLLIQEQLKMTALLEEQKKAQITLDELNYEMLTQAGKKPQRAYDSKLQNVYQQLNEANEKLKAELKALTANVPEGELLDENFKESAIGIMELIPLQKTAGFKSTYVRSDKIRSHWRKYKLSKVDKKSSEASFIKYENKEVISIDADGNETKKTVRSGKIDTKELWKQLKEASVSLKFEVDGNSFAAFMKSFMYMLRNVDYQKLEDIMQPGSFQSLCAIPIILAAEKIQIGAEMFNHLNSDIRGILRQFTQALDNEDKRVALMNSIIANPDQLKYTPPETKGSIISQ